MPKYSTYKSIYKQEVKVSAPVASTAALFRLIKMKNQMLQAMLMLSSLFRRISFMKLALVLMLVVSGFTVVGNVFAGSVSVTKHEKRVVVEPGDSLWSIALKNKPEDMRTAVYIEGIMKVNSLEGTVIKAGDVLTVPEY